MMIPERYRPKLPPYWRENDAAVYHFHAAGGEMDFQRERKEDLARQMHISTATWGLVYWEYIFQVKPKANDSYETRRARVIAKYRKKNPFTPREAKDITQLFLTPEGRDRIQVIENPDTGRFTISIPIGTLYDMEQWVEEICRRKRVPHVFIPDLYRGGTLVFSSTTSHVIVHVSLYRECGTFDCGGEWSLC